MTRALRRQQLLKIARQLVADEGMGALTMMALSERARVAKPVIYSHFSNRSAVAIALLDEHFDALSHFVRQHLVGAKTLEDYLSRMVDAAFEFEGPSETPVRKITNGFSAGDEVNQAFLRYEEAFRKHWEQVLELFGVNRELVSVAAYGLASMMDNAVYTYSISPQQKVARNTLKAMLLAAVGALAPARKRKIGEMPSFEVLPRSSGSRAAFPSRRRQSAQRPARRARA
jgi:AcrR family transcriptional regulator